MRFPPSMPPSRRPERPSAVPRRGLSPKKAVDCIRRICVDGADELGRAELEETRIGRLDHKIAKLKEMIPLIPGVEYLRTDSASGDHGLTLTDYTPFRSHRGNHPVRHSLPTWRPTQSTCWRPATRSLQRPSFGRKVAALGVRRFNKAIREVTTGLDNLLQSSTRPRSRRPRSFSTTPPSSCWSSLPGGPAVARAALASKRRAIVAGPGNPRSSSMARPAWTTRGQVDRRGWLVRQQLDLHRREAGLHRGRDLRHRRPRRTTRHGGFRSRPVRSKLYQGRVPAATTASRMSTRISIGEGPLLPCRAWASSCPRASIFCSARPDPNILSSRKSR